MVGQPSIISNDDDECGVGSVADGTRCAALEQEDQAPGTN